MTYRMDAPPSSLAEAPESPVEGYAPGLSAIDVSAAYGKKLVVDRVSFAIPVGRLTALVGPNGSGKSTLLSTIARLLKPAGGRVLLDGKSIHQLPTKAVARRLGILPQNPLLPEGLSVFDLVARGRYPHQGLLRQWSTADAVAVEDALRMTNTLALADHQVDRLSGGQRQRCWIAMALAQQTDTILLDEPIAFLDLRYQVEILDLLHDLTRHHGRTVVAVLHDLNFAVSYADMVIFLKEGTVRRTITDPRACSSALIKDVFGIDVHVAAHPQTGHPLFVPLRGGESSS